MSRVSSTFAGWLTGFSETAESGRSAGASVSLLLQGARRVAELGPRLCPGWVLWTLSPRVRASLWMGLVGNWLAMVLHVFPSGWTWVPVGRSRSSGCRAYSFGGGEFHPPRFFRSSSVLLRSALMWSRISRWSSSATACDSFASLAARSLAVIAAIWCCRSCMINCPQVEWTVFARGGGK
jgi:hypothetical protein